MVALRDLEQQASNISHFQGKSRRWMYVFDYVRGKVGHYRRALQTPDGKAVLVDLARFCRANKQTVTFNRDGSVNNELTYTLIGRRDVWLHIAQYLDLSPEELMEILYTDETEGTAR